MFSIRPQSFWSLAKFVTFKLLDYSLCLCVDTKQLLDSVNKNDNQMWRSRDLALDIIVSVTDNTDTRVLIRGKGGSKR